MPEVTQEAKELADRLGWVQPLTQITLKVAVEGEKMVWVSEDHQTVLDRINNATTRLVSFERVMGMKAHAFATRPDNVANVTPLTGAE